MIEYNDQIDLVLTTVDGYGSDVITSRVTVAAAVQMQTGFSHSNHQDVITADATVFIDPADDQVQAMYDRLEECLVVINIFGGTERNNWYKIISSSVAKDHQLCNEIDNIELVLKKTEAIPDVNS